MNRAQLLDSAAQLIAWIEKPEEDKGEGGPEPGDGGLPPGGAPGPKQQTRVQCKLVASDVIVPIPYPGCTPDWAGLMAISKKLRALSPDSKTTLVHSVIDEVESKFVLLLRRTGTHKG